MLRTEDDEYKPEKTVALMRELAGGETLAFVLPIGSPSITRVMQEKVLEQARNPLVGMIPGAEPFRNHPYIYHVRAGDLDQYRTLVRTAMTMSLKRVAVVYADIPFGRSGLAAIESMLTEYQIQPVLKTSVSVKSDADYSEVFRQLEAAQPNIVVMLIPAQIAGEFLKAYRERGFGTPITTPSYGNPDTLCAVASGKNARGVSVAQIVPNIRNTTVPLVKRFHADFAKYAPKDLKPTVLHLEGYVTTQVVLTALRRIDGKPTREKLAATLNGMQNVDLGGFRVDYGPNKRSGSRYVDVGVISNDCRVLF